MKKSHIVILFSLLIISLLGVLIYFIYFNKEKELYYTYEGKFVMSSTSHKVSNYKDLKKDYFIKEKVKNIKSNSKIIEVIYDEFGETPIVYGYYTEEEFSNYFKDQINNGLVCDSNNGFNIGEGVMLKCISHDDGFSYKKIESELCAKINENIVCIKPNDWDNINNYKQSFENAGWYCEYKNHTTGEWSDTIIPEIGNLECSKDKPSIRDNDYTDSLFCFIGNDGSAICNENTGWCGIGNDLNTWCFGNN